jgi:hypothetical protein
MTVSSNAVVAREHVPLSSEVNWQKSDYAMMRHNPEEMNSL